MNTKEELTYAPEIRALAMAMESMSLTERCAAIHELDEKAHKIGSKNGQFAMKSRESALLSRAKEIMPKNIDQYTEVHGASGDWIAHAYNQALTDVRTKLDQLSKELK